MAETIKKAKAPAKAKEAVTKKVATETPAAQKPASKTVTAKTAATQTGIAIVKPVSQADVAALAHRFWAERGYKHGQHVDDWFRAEQELRSKAS